MFAYVLIFLVCIYLISASKALDVVVERSALAYLSLLNDQPSPRPVIYCLYWLALSLC